MDTQQKTREPKTRTSPPSADATAWFCLLLNARDTSDFEKGCAARRELERLGISVRFARKAGAR